MYGLVNQAVREMVLARYGEQAWERIRSEAGSDDVFVGMEQYPDELTVALVGAASRVLGAPPGTVLRMFGEYWVDYTGAAYGDLFRMSGATLVEFARNLNSLHTRVAHLMPELRPPSFAVTDERPGEFRLHYHSTRPGLQAMLVGLMQGLGKRFGTVVEVEHVCATADGADHDEFVVRYRPA